MMHFLSMKNQTFCCGLINGDAIYFVLRNPARHVFTSTTLSLIFPSCFCKKSPMEATRMGLWFHSRSNINEF